MTAPETVQLSELARLAWRHDRGGLLAVLLSGAALFVFALLGSASQ